ncbi:MAG: DNA-directed RNA polymerase subunit D [Nanobdellota archaeon]
MMKVSIQSASDECLHFTLENVTPAYANALRRYMLNEVPTMAIDDVTFDKNDSILYDEVLAHRLGLVVFKSDLDSYNRKEKCPCKGAGCAQCELKVSLKVEGPRTVYAKDLESADPKVTPVHPDTILVHLNEGQKLEFEATARLGLGNEHSKWNPGLIWYRHKPIIKVNNKHKDFSSFKSKFPPQVFNKKGEIDTELISSAQLVDAVSGVNDEIVNVTLDNSSFIFTVESFGALSAKEIVTRSIDVFNDQLKEFGNLAKKEL